MAIVTGAGRGLGKEYALCLARESAKVVVNDVGTVRDEMTQDKTPAKQVVAEIKAAGGEAIPDYTNVIYFEGTKEMIDNAIEKFGDLNIIVNNAGILRDKMIFNMSEAEWDVIIAVHLKGTFNCTKHAAEFWRTEYKAGRDHKGRIINVVSDAGLVGNPGQSNYGAAKAGIAAFTKIAAMELERYGVRVNAICPLARTRMTEEVPSLAAAMGPKPPPGQLDPFGPENVAPLAAFLASDAAQNMNGRVFHVMGGDIQLMEG